jgi:hypothetical protein
LAAELAALRSSITAPPTCTGPGRFLQRSGGAWSCGTAVVAFGPAGDVCTAVDTARMRCDTTPAASALAKPPRCLPPGGARLGYSAAAGGWVCICRAGWGGAACDVSGGVPAASEASCAAAALPSCGLPGGTGLFTYDAASGAFACVCVDGWGGSNCAVRTL